MSFCSQHISNILQGSSVAKEENSLIIAKGITYSIPNSLYLFHKNLQKIKQNPMNMTQK